MENMRDVFLCHASEDKESVVRPLFQALENAEISCWYDEAEIRWGHSITQTVNQGLGISRYAIVVLSRAFLSKNWPQRELNAVLNLEASTGEVRVLPLVVGDAHDEVFSAYPLLNDKRYLTWAGDSAPIIKELKKLFPEDEPTAVQPTVAPMEPPPEIPMPRSAHAVTEAGQGSIHFDGLPGDKGLFPKGGCATQRTRSGNRGRFLRNNQPLLHVLLLQRRPTRPPMQNLARLHVFVVAVDLLSFRSFNRSTRKQLVQRGIKRRRARRTARSFLLA